MYVPLLNSLGIITAGTLSMIIAFRNFGIEFKIPDFEQIKYQLKEGWHVFISSIAVSLFTVSDTFILGLFTSNEIVGYYSAGLKIIRAVQKLFEPFSQAIYPYIGKKASESRDEAILFMRRAIIIVGVPIFLISCLLFFFASEISAIVLGNDFKGSIPVIQILAFLPFIILLSNFFGTQTMLNFGYQKAFSRILITAGIINITLAILLVTPLKQLGMSYSVLITEFFVTSAMLLFLQKKGISLIGIKTFPMLAKTRQ